MTIGVVWTRRGAEANELWLATDSRLSGDGYLWDDCPKLLPLPRRDTVAAFSGSTGQAYPLLLQTANAISSYRASQDGTLEFFRMLGHLERVVDSMMGRLWVDPAVRGATRRGKEFASAGDTLIVGGYSRLRNGMAIRALQYDGNIGGWRFTRVREEPQWGRANALRVFGDSPSRGRYLYLLKTLLQDRGLIGPNLELALEPLEALAWMLKLPTSDERRLPLDRRPRTIGGAPQVMRVLPGADATAFAVRWRSPSGTADYLLGRRTFHYERLDVPLIDFSGNGISFHAPGRWMPVTEMHRLLEQLVALLTRRLDDNASRSSRSLPHVAQGT